MGKKQERTPRGVVRSAIRRCWLRSRERAAALKRAGNCCEECGRKGSRAKGREVTIEVHHPEGIAWDRLIEYVFRYVLVHPDALDVLCKECHDKLHKD